MQNRGEKQQEKYLFHIEISWLNVLLLSGCAIKYQCKHIVFEVEEKEDAMLTVLAVPLGYQW